MRRKTLVCAIGVFSIALVLLCGTAAALMFRQTETLENQFEVAKVDCVVQESLNAAGNAKTSIQVKNTGNIDAYLRLKFVTYWVDSEGRIVSKPSPTLTVVPTSDWVQGADNTFYHKAPINPEALTKELLSQHISLAQSDEGYYQVVEVFADAIQSLPITAATEKWGVTIDANGNITSGR